jgi:hypothetical protein
MNGLVDEWIWRKKRKRRRRREMVKRDGGLEGISSIFPFFPFLPLTLFPYLCLCNVIVRRRTKSHSQHVYKLKNGDRKRS